MTVSMPMWLMLTIVGVGGLGIFLIFCRKAFLNTILPIALLISVVGGGFMGIRGCNQSSNLRAKELAEYKHNLLTGPWADLREQLRQTYGYGDCLVILRSFDAQAKDHLDLPKLSHDALLEIVHWGSAGLIWNTNAESYAILHKYQKLEFVWKDQP